MIMLCHESREMPSRRVEADLRRRIEADDWASGQALPSIASLAEHYGVSRATVAKALRSHGGRWAGRNRAAVGNLPHLDPVLDPRGSRSLTRASAVPS